jgi:hypothetical protein
MVRCHMFGVPAERLLRMETADSRTIQRRCVAFREHLIRRMTVAGHAVCLLIPGRLREVLVLTCEASRKRVAANGRPLGRGGVCRDSRFSPSPRVGCSRSDRQ